MPYISRKYNFMYVVSIITKFYKGTGVKFVELCVGLGRAKARPEIWPAGHGFWVARPDPGHICDGP